MDRIEGHRRLDAGVKTLQKTYRWSNSNIDAALDGLQLEDAVEQVERLVQEQQSRQQ